MLPLSNPHGFRSPTYWDNQSFRFDNVRVSVALAEEKVDYAPRDIKGKVGWKVQLPDDRVRDPSWNENETFHFLPIDRFPDRESVMKHIDHQWPPPSWIEIPEWWLHDLERLARVADEEPSQ